MATGRRPKSKKFLPEPGLPEDFVNPWFVPRREKRKSFKPSEPKAAKEEKKNFRYFHDKQSEEQEDSKQSEEDGDYKNEYPELPLRKTVEKQNQPHQSLLGNQSDEVYEGTKPEDKAEEKDEVDEEFEALVGKLRSELTNGIERKPDKVSKNEKYISKKRKWMERIEKKREEEGLPLRSEKFAGPAPIDPVRLEQHSRGEGAGTRCVRTKFHQVMLDKREAIVEEALAQGARAEVMLIENEGYLEADEGERTSQFRQSQIADAVDITTANKYFNLDLDNFGPYRIDYNRNGRYLLLGGRKGHIAAMDWSSKELLCEFNVLEEVFDIKWLHFDSMFAVAQKNAVYIYDDQGCELHRLARLDTTLFLEFLPYHFLLVAMSNNSKIGWLDISCGTWVTTIQGKVSRPSSMKQNPTNAVICVGHNSGVLTMWTPNVRAPVLRMLCDNYAIQSLDIDHRGVYMATSSSNRVKIWDLRSLKGCVQEYKLRSVAKSVCISQRGLLAMGLGNGIEVYRNALSETASEPYLRHRMLGHTQITNMQFCPYEDVLGVGHTNGLSSLIIPGAGEPNYDGLEVNPYLTKSQKKEAEVKALLEKIQPEFITYDPSAIASVDVPTMVEKLKEAESRSVFVPTKISLSHRSGRKGGTAKLQKRKEALYETQRQKFLQQKESEKMEQEKKKEEKIRKYTEQEGMSSVLERFQWQRK